MHLDVHDEAEVDDDDKILLHEVHHDYDETACVDNDMMVEIDEIQIIHHHDDEVDELDENDGLEYIQEVDVEYDDFE